MQNTWLLCSDYNLLYLKTTEVHLPITTEMCVCVLECVFTAEVRSESEREDSEGRQTARETRELVKDPLETPPPSRALPALVKPTGSELCDWLKQKKREEMGEKRWNQRKYLE